MQIKLLKEVDNGFLLLKGSLNKAKQLIDNHRRARHLSEVLWGRIDIYKHVKSGILDYGLYIKGKLLSSAGNYLAQFNDLERLKQQQTSFQHLKRLDLYLVYDYDLNGEVSTEVMTEFQYIRRVYYESLKISIQDMDALKKKDINKLFYFIFKNSINNALVITDQYTDEVYSFVRDLLAERKMDGLTVFFLYLFLILALPFVFI